MKGGIAVKLVMEVMEVMMDVILIVIGENLDQSSFLILFH